MKDRNYTNVLRLIRKSGPLTRRQIEAETGLSWGAVSNVTAHLIELGYIRECKEPLGAVPPGVGAGRIPIYLEADRETHFVIGMEMPVISTSWKESLPIRFSLTLQVMKTMGELSI